MSAPGSGKLIWDDPKLSEMYRQSEKFTGKYAQLMLEQGGFQAEADKLDKVVVLDDACGTAVVSAHIMEILGDDAKSKLDLTCADFADSMVDITKRRIEAEGWPAKAVKADAQDTKLPSDKFTHIFFNFGPMLLPDPQAGIQECRRMLRSGGTLGVATWQRVPWTQPIRECFERHPELPPFPSDEQFLSSFSQDAGTWQTTAGVRSNLERNDFIDIKVESYARNTDLNSYRDFVAMFPGSLNMVFNKWWTEEQRKEYKEKATKYCEDYVREKYGEDPITWEWIAIVGTGKKPA